MIFNHSDLVDYAAQFDTDHASQSDLEDVFYEQAYKFWDEQDPLEVYDRCISLNIIDEEDELDEDYT